MKKSKPEVEKSNLQGKKSKLEAQREAAAFTSDVGSSLDDSDDSVHGSDESYLCDGIIAERMHEDEDEDVPQYLLKFTDYPLHRQVSMSAFLNHQLTIQIRMVVP